MQTLSRHLAGIQYVSTLNLPHRWGVDFVKRDKYLFMTGVESQRKFVVLDVSDPRDMKVIAENEAGMYAARNLCLHDNLALLNLYQWINPIDVSDPTRPELLLGCQWEVDPRDAGVRRFYRFQWIGKHLFVACDKPQLAFRVYEVERTFSPRLIATVDLSGRLDEACVSRLTNPDNWYPNAEMIVDGDTIHTSFGMHVAGFDVSDPASPVVTYCHRMPSNVVGITLAKKTLYVAVNSRWPQGKGDPGEQAAVAAVDLTDPASPRILGEYKGMRVPERMVVDGNLLYLVGEEDTPAEAMHFNGVPFNQNYKTKHAHRVALHVLDVSNPEKIARKGSLPFPLRIAYYGEAVCRAVVLDGSVLYVADHEYGVRAVDVQDPMNPKFLGSLRTVTHEVRKVIPASKKRLYIVNGTCVNIADISDLRRPKLDVEGCLAPIGGWTISQPLLGPGGRFLYSIATNACEVAIADFGEPGGVRAEVVDLVPLPDGWEARDLGWARGRLYVLGVKENEWATTQLFAFEPVDGGKGLKLVGSYPTGKFKEEVGWIWRSSFHVTEDRIFILITCMDAGREGPSKLETVSLELVTVDVSNPAVPIVFAPVDLLNAAQGLKLVFIHGGGAANAALAYKDGYLYFHTADASDPDRPSRLLVYDLRTPDRPVLAASLKKPAPGKTHMVVRNLCLLSPEPYLACASEASGAWIVDIRDPHHPVTAWKDPLTARGSDTEHYDSIAKPNIAYQDGYLYVPRLDRVDIYHLDFQDGSPPSEAQRLSKARAAEAAARKTGTEVPAAQRAALQVQSRQIGFYIDRGDLQQAEAVAREIEERLEESQSFDLGQPTFRAGRVATEIQIDGKPDEWDGVPTVAFGQGPAWVKWQWDERNLYLLLRVVDPALERSPGPMHIPHCYTQDHVDVFVTSLPASVERPYGPADTHFSMDLSGNVVLHHQNPRIRGNQPTYSSRPSQMSRAAVSHTPDGYLMEMALSHEESWVHPVSGAQIACSMVITDHGDRQMVLRPARLRGYQQVQPTWPILELFP